MELCDIYHFSGIPVFKHYYYSKQIIMRSLCLSTRIDKFVSILNGDFTSSSMKEALSGIRVCETSLSGQLDFEIVGTL